ncbi:MAG: T9SS type A sorting domain-containing protein [Cytophagales bacterium]|nr:T9SS type A sorting domain-containing protein [Cytophagales bacterium]
MLTPNPTNHSVTLKVEDFKTTNLIYQLYDLTGKQLESKKVKAIETSIDMSDFVQAVYYIKVIDGNREVKVFKILKIN